MEDFLQKHRDKKEEQRELIRRMKEDAELITNVKYVMRDLDQRPIAGVVGVMSNRPALFASFVEAALKRATEQVSVTSENESLDTAYLEDAIRRLFNQANQSRREQGLVSIEAMLDQQHCLRGRSMTLLLMEEVLGDKGRPALDIEMTPWDVLGCTGEQGKKGLAWAAHEMVKTKSEVDSEAWAIKRGFTLSDKKATVVDIWRPDIHEIFVDSKRVFDEENLFGFVPVVWQVVPIGLMFGGAGNLAYEGESIFSLIRYLIPEFNRMASIMQTQNMRSLFGAQQEAVGEGGEAHEWEDVNAPGRVTPVKVPNAISLIPYSEVRESLILLLREISKELDDGTISRITMGDLPGAMSSLALLQVEQGQGQLTMPRLGSRGIVKQSLAEMAFREMQLLELKTIELGTLGHTKRFNVPKFDGEYSIEFIYTQKSPETDFARWSLAKQVEGKLDDETILREIVRRDDPEGDLARLRRQQLRAGNPTLVVLDGLKALTKLYADGDKSVVAEIDIVEATLGVDIDMILAGQVPTSAPQGQQVKEEALPITSGAGRSPAKRAADLSRSPSDEIRGEV